MIGPAISPSTSGLFRVRRAFGLFDQNSPKRDHSANPTAGFAGPIEPSIGETLAEPGKYGREEEIWHAILCMTFQK